MTTDKPPALMDNPAIRGAYIRWRVAQLKVLAAEAALDYTRAQPKPSLQEMLHTAILRRRNGGRRP